jgi:tripartite-type tricarboxylate transporter receptor subunit TctC
MNISRRALTGALPLLAAPETLRAQAPAAWPSRPIRLIIPFPPGGATDAVGRTIGQVIAAAITQPLVAENRGGAGGNIGAELVAKAEPDGHTLLVTTASPAAMGPHLYPRLGYDPVQDLVGIARVCHTPNAVIARGDFPAANLAEAIALIRSRPGELTYGSPGNGTSGHLTGEYLNHAAGLAMQHVPYRGTGPLVTDLLGGRLDLVHDNLPAYLQHARDGRVKLLAVTSAARWYSAPEVPTVAEAAPLPGFEAMVWWGVQAPAGTPAPIIARLSEILTAGFATAEVRDRLRAFSLDPAPMGTVEFGPYIAAEYRRWGEVVRAAGIHID